MVSNNVLPIPRAFLNGALSGSRSRPKYSNKRVTRLDSDIELGQQRLLNRNPRNLEQLSFENKPTGFWLDRAPNSNWNKLVFEKKGRYLNACLQHWSGRKLVEASTKEPQLQKYFVNPNTTQAATILAQVIARRCLQSGYLYAGCPNDLADDEVGQKTRQFFEVVKSNGIVLEEPPEIVPRDVTDM